MGRCALLGGVRLHDHLLWRDGRAPTPDRARDGARHLADSAGAEVVGTIVQERQNIDAAYFIGSGKAEEIRDRAEATKAEIVLVDHELSPSQERNLEKLVGRRVLDRAGISLVEAPGAFIVRNDRLAYRKLRAGVRVTPLGQPRQ